MAPIDLISCLVADELTRRGEFAPLGQITEDHVDKQFNVNVKGLLFTVQKALPSLQPGGSIVLNASTFR